MEGVFHVAWPGRKMYSVVVGVMRAKGTGEILGAEECEVVCHWEDLCLTVQV